MTTRTMCRYKIGVAIFAMVALILTGIGAEAATVIVDGQGFESPDYSTTFPGGTGTGQLEGQDGWLRTSGPASSTADVQTAVVYSGDQAVQVDRAANSDDRWAVPVTGWPSQPRVLIDWDMRVEWSGEECCEGKWGPFFGVDAWDDAGDIGLLGSLGVDATTGDVLYQDEDTGYFVETGTEVTFGDWNHFQIILDYSTHDYSVYMNGSLLATVGFVDQNNVLGGLDQFTDADIAALAAYGNPESQALTGTAYYDNFMVRQVPEPASALIALLGVVGLMAVRIRWSI